MIFVTGTDTGCGKTTVGRALCAALRTRGQKIGVFKPIETGCEEVDGHLAPVDARALARAAGCTLPIDTICPNRFRMPASPERAAAEEGFLLDEAALIEAWKTVRKSFEFIVTEGAGGLLVPITTELMMVDLPKLFELPVVVVARDALGTVNHTLLTIEAIRARGLELGGVIFSSTDSAGSSLDNARAITTHGEIPILGVLPYLPNADDKTLARAAEEHLDLRRLIELGRA